MYKGISSSSNKQSKQNKQASEAARKAGAAAERRAEAKGKGKMPLSPSQPRLSL